MKHLTVVFLVTAAALAGGCLDAPSGHMGGSPSPLGGGNGSAAVEAPGPGPARALPDDTFFTYTGQQEKMLPAYRTEWEVTAERMAAVLNQARDDVQQVSASQQRDMHYNMAVVYAKEGRIKAAEAEYLNALRLDSMDAATHYNLGILYDDELNDKGRASMHYRRYLKLSPSATDREQVREWLMRLDMR